MKIVGLISGGKDSLFNLLHCVANGHEIVALANLCPPIDGPEEMDSFMYQTVGSTIVPYIAQCMDKPLIQRTIQGVMKCEGLLYNKHAEDEVEDLYELLADVQRAYPMIEGVSVGAILSNYQRVRVENVCQRLGLKSLSYLWQMDQAELLEDMVECGIEAVIVKFASMGIRKSDLGQPLSFLKDKFIRMHQQFGFHPAGEGGEYETIVLDCPLFEKRLKLDMFDVVSESDDQISSVMYITNAQISFDDGKSVAVRELELMNSISYIRSKYRIDQKQTARTCSQLMKVKHPFNLELHIPQSVLHSTKHKTLSVCAYGDAEIAELKDQWNDLIDKVKRTCDTNKYNFSNCVYTNVLLADMNDFAGINNSYRLTFGSNHPCPRACYATVMPSSSKVGIQALFVADLKRVTQRLHVQSLSYWAPANIGPYSQSFTVSLSPSTDWQSLIVSGQIGMIPSSLALTSAEEECELALAHANSVIAASIPAFASGPSPLTCDAVQVITSVNEVIESHVTNSSNTCTLMSAICLTTDMTNASHYSNIYLEEQESFYAPAVILQVTQLPKNATIEWLTQTFVPNPVNCDQDIGEEEQEDDNEGEVEMKVVRLCRMSDDNCKALMMHSFQIRRGCNRKQWEPVSTLILSKGRSMGNVIEEFELSNCWQATIYNTVGVSDEECAVLGAEIVAAQVPVLSIADVEGKRTDWTHALMMSH